VSVADLALPPPAESSADVAARVVAARTVQRERLAAPDRKGKLLAVEADHMAGLLAERARRWQKPGCNADIDGALLAAIAEPDAEGHALLTLADLDGSDSVRHLHIAEALSCRRTAMAA